MSINYKNPSRDSLAYPKKPQKAKQASILCKVYEPKNPNKAAKDQQSKPESENYSKSNEASYNSYSNDKQYKKDYEYDYDEGKASYNSGYTPKAARGKNNGSGRKAGGYGRGQWVKQIVPKEKTSKTDKLTPQEKDTSDSTFSFTTPEKENPSQIIDISDNKFPQTMSTISALSNISGGASTEATLESRRSLASVVDLLDGVEFAALKGKNSSARQLVSTLMDVGRQDSNDSDETVPRKIDPRSPSDRKNQYFNKKGRSSEAYTLKELEICKETEHGPGVSDEGEESDHEDRPNYKEKKAQTLFASAVFDESGGENGKTSTPENTPSSSDQKLPHSLHKIKSFEHIPNEIDEIDEVDEVDDDQFEKLKRYYQQTALRDNYTEPNNHSGPNNLAGPNNHVEPSMIPFSNLARLPQPMGRPEPTFDNLRGNDDYIPNIFFQNDSSYERQNHFHPIPTHPQPHHYHHQHHPHHLLPHSHSHFPIPNAPDTMASPIIPDNNIFQMLVPDYYDAKIWFYLDVHQMLQGPFSGRDMDQWYVNGFLPQGLLITIGKQTGFRKLEELAEVASKMAIKPHQPLIDNEVPQLPGSYHYNMIAQNPQSMSHAQQPVNYPIHENIPDSQGILDFHQGENRPPYYFGMNQNSVNTPTRHDILDSKQPAIRLRVVDLSDDHEEFKTLEADIYHFNNSAEDARLEKEGSESHSEHSDMMQATTVMRIPQGMRHIHPASPQLLQNLTAESIFASQRPTPQENISKSQRTEPFDLVQFNQTQDSAWKNLKVDAKEL